jgi:hypothetical protein
VLRSGSPALQAARHAASGRIAFTELYAAAPDGSGELFLKGTQKPDIHMGGEKV